LNNAIKYSPHKRPTNDDLILDYSLSKEPFELILEPLRNFVGRLIVKFGLTVLEKPRLLLGGKTVFFNLRVKRHTVYF